jgi:hypothetical protein
LWRHLVKDGASINQNTFPRNGGTIQVVEDLLEALSSKFSTVQKEKKNKVPPLFTYIGYANEKLSVALSY